MKLSAYRLGTEVLGDGIGDFVPWLGVVGKIAGGAGSIASASDKKKDDKSDKKDDKKTSEGNSAAAIKQAFAEERMRQETEKAKDAASRSNMILVGVGVVAVSGVMGLLAWLIAKK